MKITVFGTGYVGLVTGVCLSELGNDVLCVDIDYNKIALLKNGKSPIYERGMDDLLHKNMLLKRLSFTTDVVEGVKHGEYLFVAVGTPSAPDGSADLKYVFSVVDSIGQHLDKYCVVVNKSTVVVGTADKVRDIISSALSKRGLNIEFDVVSNPEFLKQGEAIEDFMHSDRIIIGADNQRAFDKMHLLYETLDTCIVNMDVRSSELTKYAANAFLATRISFMNDIALLSEKMGADVEKVRMGIGTDPRVGRYFLKAGCGYGGSCFPKDVKALLKMSRDLGYEAELFASVEAINERQKNILVSKMEKYFNGELNGKTIALWGLAFKPHTDDMRDAPSKTLLECLWKSGVRVNAYDPIAMNEARRIYGLRKDFFLCDSALDALDNADALVIVTEWEEFLDPNFTLIKSKLKNKVIFDGRNLYDPNKIESLGIDYYCIGRGSPL